MTFSFGSRNRGGLLRLLGDWLLCRSVLPYWLVFLLVAGANVANVRFALALNEWNGRFFNALQRIDEAAIYDALFDFIFLASALIAMLVLTQYVKNRLLLALRRDLTFRLIDKWLNAESAHFLLRESGHEPDNPDQRIIEDARALVTRTVNLLLSFLESVMTIGSFSVLLWTLSGSATLFGITIPGYMFWICVLYTIAATGITHLIGRPLKRLNFEAERAEADLRWGFMEKRRHADSIAGAGGEAAEATNLRRRFYSLLNVLVSLVKKQRDLDFFTVGLGQVTHLAPIFFALPTFLAGGIQLGGLMQIRGAFTDVARSFSWFIFAYDDLAALAATTERLSKLVNGIEEADEERRNNLSRIRLLQDDCAERFSVDADMHVPNAHAPLPVRLSACPGETVAVTGPSGVGKSTFLKLLAGYFGSYSGTFSLRPGTRTMWLPQKPYLFKGTLAENIVYLAPSDEVDIAELENLLESVGLAALKTRLYDEADWINVLSGGEAQRVVSLRAKRFEPDVLLLDEATSALDAAAAKDLLLQLRRVLPETTIVFVTHQEALLDAADRVLRLSHDGSTTKPPSDRRDGPAFAATLS